MNHLQAGIKSIVPLSGVLTSDRWDHQAIVCTLVSEYILKSSQDLKWLNPVAIGSVIMEASTKAGEMTCPKAQNIEDILGELDIKDMCVASWTSQNQTPLSTFISRISLDRYAKVCVCIVAVGNDLVVLAANADRIYIVDPRPRNGATGGPPLNNYSKGVIVAISNFFGIGNYLHNYNEGSFDSESVPYVATTLALPVQPPVQLVLPVQLPVETKKTKVKKEKVMNISSVKDLDPVDDMDLDDNEEEHPTPPPPSPVKDVKEEEDKSPKRSADEMDEEVEVEVTEVKKKPMVHKKKRVVGISKRRKSTRGKK